MRIKDSLDKIIGIYLGLLCRETFYYKDRTYHPRLVKVSPLIVRGFTCPTGCGACCGNFSLDYLPSELTPLGVKKRLVQISGKMIAVYSDQQDDQKRWCKHLDIQVGRCREYTHRPLSCDFELIRVMDYSDHTLVTQKQYGRFWAMQRVDGELSALCEMLPPNEATVSEVIRKFDRLQQWADQLNIKTCIPEIRTWLLGGEFSRLLLLSA